MCGYVWDSRDMSGHILYMSDHVWNMSEHFRFLSYNFWIYPELFGACLDMPGTCSTYLDKSEAVVTCRGECVHDWMWNDFSDHKVFWPIFALHVQYMIWKDKCCSLHIHRLLKFNFYIQYTYKIAKQFQNIHSTCTWLTKLNQKHSIRLNFSSNLSAFSILIILLWKENQQKTLKLVY